MKHLVISLLLGMTSFLTATAQITADDLLDSLINDVQQGKEVANVVTDVNTQIVHYRSLLVGDALVEGLAPRLYSYERSNGRDMQTVIWMGSTT